MKYIKSLDGIRALAVFAVMLFHYGYLGCGWIGVQIFFVLSGFLITGILLREKERAPSTFFLHFYLRRTVRIWPLYFCYLLMVFGLYLASGEPVQVRQYLGYLLTFSFNLARMQPSYHETAYLGHLWSLGIEEQFYLVWPLFVFALNRRKLTRISVLFLCLCPFVRLLLPFIYRLLFSENSSFANLQNFPLSHFDAFAAGALLALDWQMVRTNISLKFAGACFTTSSMGILTLLYLKKTGHAGISSLGYPCDSDLLFQHVWGYSLLNLTSVLLIACVLNYKIFKGFFESRGLVYCGKISFGLYIWHPAIQEICKGLNVAGQPIRGLAGFVLSTILTLLVATISYYTLESYFLRLKRFFGSAGSTPRPVAAPALPGALTTLEG